jgi:hypothetical protein
MSVRGISHKFVKLKKHSNERRSLFYFMSFINLWLIPDRHRYWTYTLIHTTRDISQPKLTLLAQLSRAQARSGYAEARGRLTCSRGATALAVTCVCQKALRPRSPLLPLYSKGT